MINLLMFWLRLLDTKDGRGSKQTVEAIAKATMKGLPRGTLRMCENLVQLLPNECLSFFAKKQCKSMNCSDSSTTLYFFVNTSILIALLLYELP